MQMLFSSSKWFSGFKILILLLSFNNIDCFSQTEQRVRIIWTDNAFNTSNKQQIYLLSVHANDRDTIFPSQWNPLQNDTVYFEINKFRNPVYIEILSDTISKKSNKFNLIINHTYILTELDNELVIRARPLIFDTLDSNAQLLYSFLIKLLIELLIAIPIAALLRLPARLIFFVFVANIMSFPLVYIPLLPDYIQELLTIILEGVFIFAIGWKRLKFTKALLLSLILNVIRFGIYKIVILVIKII